MLPVAVDCSFPGGIAMRYALSVSGLVDDVKFSHYGGMYNSKNSRFHTSIRQTKIRNRTQTTLFYSPVTSTCNALQGHFCQISLFSSRKWHQTQLSSLAPKLPVWGISITDAPQRKCKCGRMAAYSGSCNTRRGINSCTSSLLPSLQV